MFWAGGRAGSSEERHLYFVLCRGGQRCGTSGSCTKCAEDEAPEGQHEWADFVHRENYITIRTLGPPPDHPSTHAGPHWDANVEESGGCGESEIVI